MTGADVLRVIRSNLWLILISLVLFSAAGYVANYYLAKHYPRYTARGLVQILPNLSFDPLSDRQQMMDHRTIAIEQRTQAQLLRHDALFSRVLTRSDDIRQTSWFAQFGANPTLAKRDLEDNLRVSPIPDTKLVVVEMSHRDPKACRVIVQEIVRIHLEDQKQIHVERHLARTAQLNNMRGDYQFRRSQVQRDLHQKAAQLSIDNMGIPGRMSGKEMELAKLIETQLAMRMNRDAANTAYEAIVEQLQQGIDPPRVQEYVKMDPQIRHLEQSALMLEVQLEARQARYGSRHPYVRELQTQYNAYQQRLDALRGEARARARVMLTEELKSQTTQIEQGLETLNAQIDAVRRELGDLSNDMARYLTLRDEEKAYAEMLRVIEEQLDGIRQAQVSADAGGVAWAMLPQEPDRPSFPRLAVTMPLAIALGLAFSLGIAFLREAMDTSVRSPRDIARVGQMNLLGMIPHESDDPQAGAVRLPLVIFEAPHSVTAEQFRQVRTRLQHGASLDTTRSILVTSPSPGDGKSTVACNLAAGLALNGRRILLVDANFRRPELHRIFALSNERGFADVLSSIENFESAVQETQVPNLSVLPSGAKPVNPTELLESQLLIDFIERALEEYDHVIFDSGPFLFVSDSVALAPRVDGVVTVVRAQASSRGLLQRMRDGLRQTRAEHLGVVLNAVRAQGGGYYGRNIKTFYAYQNGQGNN